MGAGASAKGVSEALKASAVDELASFFKGSPEEFRTKIENALEEEVSRASKIIVRTPAGETILEIEIERGPMLVNNLKSLLPSKPESVVRLLLAEQELKNSEEVGGSGVLVELTAVWVVETMEERALRLKEEIGFFAQEAERLILVLQGLLANNACIRAESKDADEISRIEEIARVQMEMMQNMELEREKEEELEMVNLMMKKKAARARMVAKKAARAT